MWRQGHTRHVTFQLSRFHCQHRVPHLGVCHTKVSLADHVLDGSDLDNLAESVVLQQHQLAGFREHHTTLLCHLPLFLLLRGRCRAVGLQLVLLRRRHSVLLHLPLRFLLRGGHQGAGLGVNGATSEGEIEDRHAESPSRCHRTQRECYVSPTNPTNSRG